MFYKSFIILYVAASTLANSHDWEYNNAPGVAMEYKIHIDAGKEDCFWQYVYPGATIYVNMQVLKGGDGMAGMAVKNPKNEIVHPYEWKESSEFEGTALEGGYYSVCIDNQFSRMASKLVNLYLTTFRHDLWENYTKELEEMDVGVNNFTESLKNVDQRIHDMLQHQSHTRALEGRDYQLMLQNSDYVLYWSVAQCIAILLVTVSQVIAVRRLFLDGFGSSGKTSVRA